MEIHYTKHHQAYIDNLNKALAEYPALQGKTLEYLLTHLDELPEAIRAAVRNNGGGHYNHSFFWPSMIKKAGLKPTGLLAQEIVKKFGNHETFQTSFTNAAKSVFGSGWAWLVLDKKGALSIMTTPNQDTPLFAGLHPILGLDIWEHAYYLKYQNKRPDYIEAWWHVVNWEHAEEQYRIAIPQ
jgi:Fe-Mn family superoxide dismutase